LAHRRRPAIDSISMTLVSIPANPVPDNVVSGTITTPDGRSLRFARWAPPPGRKGTVCVFAGRTEYIEKYFETVVDLRARGFAVAMLDWRGQGMSDRALKNPRKGYVKNFSEYDIDLNAFMTQVVLPDCPPPFFALGHSMGGAIMLRAARQRQRWFDRIVLSSPMIALQGTGGLTATRFLIRSLRFIGGGSRYVPGGDDTVVGSKPFLGNALTSDPVRYARNAAILAAEPALGLAAPTVAWTDAALREMGELADPSLPGHIRQPILIVATGRDKVVSTPAIEEFALRLRTGSHLIVAGAMHEVLMEQDRYRAQFWAAFDAFVPGTPVFA
jgi:lysophospholipase